VEQRPAARTDIFNTVNENDIAEFNTLHGVLSNPDGTGTPPTFNATRCALNRFQSCVDRLIATFYILTKQQPPNILLCEVLGASPVSHLPGT
jgi:hypothetical protein